MDMFDDLGFCPSSQFKLYEERWNDKTLENWGKAKEVLSDRINMMYYPIAEVNTKGYCYIVDALAGAQGNLGENFAEAFAELIHVGEVKPVVCRDVINPLQIPIELKNVIDKRWKFANDKDECENCRILQDERYLLVIMDMKEENEVHVYLYRK